MLKLFAGQICDEFSQTVSLVKNPSNSVLKLLAGRLATNFRKQFISRRTPQFNPQTVCWPTGDEVSQTVCLVIFREQFVS